MKILFLVYHGFSEFSGISKKIHYQVKGLRENGYEVHVCHYGFDDRGHRCRYIDDQVVKDYGTGEWAAMHQRLDYRVVYKFCKENRIEMVYARCFMNANPWLIRFFKKLNKLGIRSVTEIPTYPYDEELKSWGWRTQIQLKIDQTYRERLGREMVAYVTFSDAEQIFGQRTIRISNGVDFDSIPLHQFHSADDGALHMIAVAEMHIWHGYDRLVAGIGEYYRNTPHPRKIIFHMVGEMNRHDMNEGNSYHPAYKAMIAQYGIEENIIFHGALFGEELDRVFNQCQFAIGSLARHRSGITVIKTLKNREYATRGLPFIYSEMDSDFDEQPYVLKVPADESPIDVQRILDFIDQHQFNPQDIRKTVEHLTWKIQMKKVVDEVFDNKL